MLLLDNNINIIMQKICYISLHKPFPHHRRGSKEIALLDRIVNNTINNADLLFSFHHWYGIVYYKQIFKLN